jgi:hypothetical protein
LVPIDFISNFFEIGEAAAKNNKLALVFNPGLIWPWVSVFLAIIQYKYGWSTLYMKNSYLMHGNSYSSGSSTPKKYVLELRFQVLEQLKY